ncbi:MAG: hypothetical protein JST30_01330 [Armatimonadetes bacterium]|nr:hypothetical protein [Armatimonadota bacterium]
MYVPPYFPEPITVSGNVADARYRERVRFLRTVVGRHFLSVAVVAAFGLWRPFEGTTTFWAFAFAAGLVALTFVRRTASGSRWDGAVSLAVLLPVLAFAGLWLRGLDDNEFPVFSFAVVSSALGAYSLFCGQDFSYTGQFVLCNVASALFCVSMTLAGRVPGWNAAAGWAVGALYTFYYTYDLSMIVKRRRPDEAWAAVADLYRDLINFSTYPVRVFLHWRRFSNI